MYEPKFLKLWTMPESYFGAVHPNTYVSFGQNRGSDCVDRSNFQVALKALQAVSDEVEVIREGHWACGWIEWIAINADDFAALEVADGLAKRYASYPLLNEDHFSELESEEAEETWRTCYRVKDRIAYIRDYRDQFEFQSLADMLGCVRGKYFAGYASELVSR